MCASVKSDYFLRHIYEGGRNTGLELSCRLGIFSCLSFAGERSPGYLRRGNSYPANYADAVAIDKAPLPRAIGHYSP